MTEWSVLLMVLWLFGCFYFQFDSFQSWRFWTFTNYHLMTDEDLIVRHKTKHIWEGIYPIFHYSPSYDFHWFVVCHFCAWNYMNVFRMKSRTVCVVQYTTWTRAKMLVEKKHCNFFLKKSLDLFREIHFYCCGTVCTVPPFCVVCECSLMQCANSYPSLSFTFCRNNFLLVVRVECWMYKGLYHAFAFIF